MLKEQLTLFPVAGLMEKSWTNPGGAVGAAMGAADGLADVWEAWCEGSIDDEGEGGKVVLEGMLPPRTVLAMVLAMVWSPLTAGRKSHLRQWWPPLLRPCLPLLWLQPHTDRLRQNPVYDHGHDVGQP